MVQNAEGIGEILKLLTGGTGDGAKQLENRARRGQMTFAATQYAGKSGCKCDACAFLRKAVDEEYAEARREAGLNDNGDDSLTREVVGVPGRGEPGGQGGSDLPDNPPVPADRVSGGGPV